MQTAVQKVANGLQQKLRSQNINIGLWQTTPVRLYCKHHSTETALAYIHDHLINAIGSQKKYPVSAYSTYPRPTTVLNWFKSYLSFRSFRVKCSNSLSSFHTSSCGVPQILSSVLYFLSYVHHPTKYSHLISITQPSPVCRRHTVFLLFLPTRSSL